MTNKTEKPTSVAVVGWCLGALAWIVLGCGSIDADHIGDEGGTLYYSCDPGRGGCAEGFVCLSRVLSPGLGEVEAEPVSVCVRSEVVPSDVLDVACQNTIAGLGCEADALAELDMRCQTSPDMEAVCGSFLECREESPFDETESLRCLLPLVCTGNAAGEASLPGDQLRCPAGFQCVADTDSTCAFCAFTTCEGARYRSVFMTLGRLDSDRADACWVARDGTSSDWPGQRLGQVICGLDVNSDHDQCPTGWQRVDGASSLGDGVPSTCTSAIGMRETFCVIDATVANGVNTLSEGLLHSSGALTPTALVVPAERARSCRPGP